MYIYNKYINRLNKISIKVHKHYINLSRENSQKKCVFRRALKVAKLADVLMLLGRVVHKVS